MLATLLVLVLVPGQVDLPSAKPVPRMQVIPLPDGQASIERDGQEISRYWFGPELRRPFLFPLIGPSGKSLTRMGHPRDPNGHSHHNSVWVTHHDVGGVAFWNDAASSKGRIVHQRVVKYEDADDEALIEVVNQWQEATASAPAQGEKGRLLLEEQRTMRFRPQSGGQWLLILDLAFSAPKEPVTLGKTQFRHDRRADGQDDRRARRRRHDSQQRRGRQRGGRSREAGPLGRLFGPDHAAGSRGDHALRSSEELRIIRPYSTSATTAGWAPP